MKKEASIEERLKWVEEATKILMEDMMAVNAFISAIEQAADLANNTISDSMYELMRFVDGPWGRRIEYERENIEP